MALKDFIKKINKKTCVLQAIKVENPETLFVTKRETIESLGIPTEVCSEDQRKLKAQSEDAFENDKQMKSSNSNANDEFTEIFDSAVPEISQNYSDGSIEFIEKNHPDKWGKSINIENSINGLWDEGIDLDTFKKAVNEWKIVWLEMVRLFRKFEKRKCVRCGSPEERYCLDQDKDGKWVWGWQCLRCKPYTESKRN